MERDIRLFFHQHQKLVFWSVQLFIWTLYFIFDVEVLHRYAYTAFRSLEVRVYLRPLVFCYFGFPITLIIKWIADRYFLSGKTNAFYWIALLMLAIGLGVAWYGVDRVLEEVFNDHGGYANELVDFFWKVFINSLILVAWTLFYLFVRLWQEWMEQKYRTEQALLMAENARLRMLRYQVNPHFLFNTLSSLRGLIRQDPGQAVTMVGLMAEFMRYSLGGKSDQSVPLREEIRAVRNYIGIEKVRFGDKLEINYELDEASLGVPVPGFILHPLVENAVKYGMETSPMPLRITVRTSYLDGRLSLMVSNTGQWMPQDSGIRGTGTGIQNVRERLAVSYPSKHRFEIISEAGKVSIFILIDTGNDQATIDGSDRG